MLKIKDNVDLKELERYGLVVTSRPPYYDYQVLEKKTEKGSLIFSYRKKEFLYINGDCVDTLFDLINAGLVEKVEE